MAYNPNEPRDKDGKWTALIPGYIMEKISKNQKIERRLRQWNIEEANIDNEGNYVLYHGTTEEAEASILQHGLKAPQTTPGWYMLTTQKDAAKEFALGYEKTGKSGRVLEIKIPLDEVPKLIWPGVKTSFNDTQHALQVNILDKKYIQKLKS